MMNKVILLIFLSCLLLFSCQKDNPKIDIEEMIVGNIEIQINPSGIAPLTAVIKFKSTLNTSARFSLDGDDKLYFNFDSYTTEHDHKIFGLFPGVENHLYLKISNDIGQYAIDTLKIITEPVPAYLPDINIITADKNAMEAGWTLCCTALGGGEVFLPYTITFDENGDYRSILSFVDKGFDFAAPMELLSNGNILFGLENMIYEYNMMGEEINSWELDEKYVVHHDIIEKPNSNLVVAVADHTLQTVDDIIIEMDRNSGAEINRWDLREVMDVDRFDLNEDAIDWLHMNAIWYSESDDCLLMSGRNQGVVKITNDNELVWILAPHLGWGKSGPNGNGFETSDYLLTAIDAEGNPFDESVQLGNTEPDDFSWVWGQHAPMYLPNGNIFIFDNGLNRNFANAGPFSRGVEYKINEENKSIQQIWEYGKDRGEEFYSLIISDVDYLPSSGNRLITSGITFSFPDYSTIVEVSYPDKNPVFEAKLSYKGAFIPEGAQGWGALDLTYRSERINFFK